MQSSKLTRISHRIKGFNTGKAMYINNLDTDQITEINAYLAKHHYGAFDDKTIAFFNTLAQENNDPLGLIGHSGIGLRGQLIKLENSHRYAGDKDKVPHHVILLNTTNITGIFDVLFLNSEFKPVGVNTLKLIYL